MIVPTNHPKPGSLHKRVMSGEKKVPCCVYNKLMFFKHLGVRVYTVDGKTEAKILWCDDQSEPFKFCPICGEVLDNDKR